MAVEYEVSHRGRIQPPMELDQTDDAYRFGDDTLRTYTHPETGQEFFSVTSIQGAVHETPKALKNWEAADPEWANYWRHFTSVRGTYIHEVILGQYADRPMPGPGDEFELDTEAPMEELKPEDRTKVRKHAEKAKNMWAKIWGPMGHSFGDVQGVEVRVWNEEMKYAGTFDLLMYIDGKLTLVDLKTAKSYYPKYAEQLSAYQVGAEEMYDIDIEQRLVVRLCPDRRHNPFQKPSLHWAPDLTDQWRDLCAEFQEDVVPLLEPVDDDE